MIKKYFDKVVLGAGLVVASAGAACAEFTLPTLPVTDIEGAGVAVAGLVAAYVVIRLAIRMIKSA